MLGLPVTSSGIVLRLTCLTGEVISPIVTPDCAGFATVSVFLTLFALMMLDIRLPLRRAWYIFLLGFIGTWFQDIIRLVVIIIASYYWGTDGLEFTHNNASYVIFPLWYMLFAFIYLRQVERKSILAPK